MMYPVYCTGEGRDSWRGEPRRTRRHDLRLHRICVLAREMRFFGCSAQCWTMGFRLREIQLSKGRGDLRSGGVTEDFLEEVPSVPGLGFNQTERTGMWLGESSMGCGGGLTP